MAMAFSTALASSDATSGGMPLLLYTAPLCAPTYSSTVTSSSPPSLNVVGDSAPRQPMVVAPTSVARLFSRSESANTSVADALRALRTMAIGSWYAWGSRRSLFADAVPALPVFTSVFNVGSPVRQQEDA